MLAVQLSPTPRIQRKLERVLALIRQKPSISYDEIAARLLISRSTAIQAVYMLESQQKIMRLKGRGSTPNRYICMDRVIKV